MVMHQSQHLDDAIRRHAINDKVARNGDAPGRLNPATRQPHGIGANTAKARHRHGPV